MNADTSRPSISRLLSVTAATVAVFSLSLYAGGGQKADDARHSQPASLSAATIAARRHYFGRDNVDTTGEVRHDRVILSWMGVSSFAASFNGRIVLLDGWIPRGAPCYPH